METFKANKVSAVYICIMNLKESLLASAHDLFMKYGIKSVSMDDISKRLGVSKKTIYSCVATKDDLIASVLDKHLEKDECEIKKILSESSDAIDEMVNITRHLITFLSNMTPSIIYDLKKYHPISWGKIETSHFSFIEKTILENLNRGQNEGLYRHDINPKILSKLYVLKSTAIADHEKFPIEDFDRVSLILEVIKYHLYGIVSDKGLKIIQQKHKTFFNL